MVSFGLVFAHRSFSLVFACFRVFKFSFGLESIPFFRAILLLETQQNNDLLTYVVAKP